MNSLENFIRTENLDHFETINMLQNHTIISDLCVVAADVCDGDCLLAIAFLKSAESGIKIPASRNK